MKKTAYGNILEISSFAAKILLENGAEIIRVEQTVEHICHAYSAGRSECYASPTGIMISIIGSGGEVHSVVRRISKRKVNLRKIELINNFSRNLGAQSSSFEEVKEQLVEIDQIPSYPLLVMLLTAAVGTAGFTIVFGGGPWDIVAGFLSGALVHLSVGWVEKLGSGSFFTNMIGGAVCALFGWLFTALGIVDDWWIVTISSLMLLVPGMLLTNALRDFAAGDFVSGLSRGAEALCIAAALAGGAAAVIYLVMRGGGIS